MLLGRKTYAFMSALLLIAALVAIAAVAHAVGTQGAPTATPSHPDVNVVSSYTFGSYALRGQDIVFEYELTFPEGFDITDAVPLSPVASIVSKDTASRTIRLLLAESWSRPDRVLDFTVGGVKNPAAAGTYAMPDIRFLVGQQNRPNQAPVWESVAAGPITIIVPYLSVSISANTLAFELSPEVPTAPQDISVTVDSSHEYTVTREISGDAELIGLQVTGQAEGIHPAGLSVLTDTYTAEVPWTTEGDRTYTSTITYTVVQ